VKKALLYFAGRILTKNREKRMADRRRRTAPSREHIREKEENRRSGGSSRNRHQEDYEDYDNAYEEDYDDEEIDEEDLSEEELDSLSDDFDEEDYSDDEVDEEDLDMDSLSSMNSQDTSDDEELDFDTTTYYKPKQVNRVSSIGTSQKRTPIIKQSVRRDVFKDKDANNVWNAVNNVLDLFQKGK